MKDKNLTNDENEFLDHSNRIEGEYSEEAFEDAVKAWEYAKSCETIGLTELFEIHRLLLHRIQPEDAGHFRNHPIRIGGQIKKYLGPEVMESMAKGALADINGGESLGLAAQRAAFARKAHIRYEDLHPFPDGNGRSGRILYNWQRIKLGLPIHIIHEGDEQMEYYTWFKKDHGTEETAS